ncbi:hypothetical protein Dfer_1954 [Dyadobacter fermentans DSM 18053]|uniref:Outer membrane protein beta-barrel domain-containing protein n=1 Tax=Dyadobacter fermentans (strain ATCC 700827 / DSM 18053 / CIP 107007 / KCTC 52180 / NS114) TaxID=471854 RepID=C6VW46_DYAFD|nr:hypothetical protein Dfer_1954 [Dyadobacter fermentans DSM 18053]
MKSLRLIVLFVFLGSLKAFSQDLSRVTSGLDVGLGYQSEVWVPSVTYHQELSLSNFPWFRIGWGVRAWGYYGGRTDMFPKSSAVSSDTLKFGRLSANGASFLLGANFRLWKFDIGANTDLFGVAFGLKRQALYANGGLYDEESGEYYNKYLSSGPATLNALPLVLDKQNGQSEAYIRYWITDRIGVKLAYVHGRVTYASPYKLVNGQTRYSTTFGVPYLALSFPLYN